MSARKSEDANDKAKAARKARADRLREDIRRATSGKKDTSKQPPTPREFTDEKARKDED